MTHNGCVWRALPAGFPPWPRFYDFFRTWEDSGVTKKRHDAVRDQVRRSWVAATGRTPHGSC
ncbi:transposase [Frankia sp. Cr1]|uniref:transposase n=2 Tax=unclassified Frankia TaxID=2632575 RepID=UPI003A101027